MKTGGLPEARRMVGEADNIVSRIDTIGAVDGVDVRQVASVTSAVNLYLSAIAHCRSIDSRLAHLSERGKSVGLSEVMNQLSLNNNGKFNDEIRILEALDRSMLETLDFKQLSSLRGILHYLRTCARRELEKCGVNMGGGEGVSSMTLGR